MSLTTMLNPTETWPAALSTPRSVTEIELAETARGWQTASAKRHQKVMNVLFSCIFNDLHEQK